MPAGAPPGARRGGRVAGVPNRKTVEVQAILDRLKCNPYEVMALIAINKVPCGVCHGKGKTRYKITNADGKSVVGERLCESCYGTLMEHISPDLRGRMAAELAQYVGAKRKAIEVSNPDGTLRPSWEVVILNDKPQ